MKVRQLTPTMDAHQFTGDIEAFAEAIGKPVVSHTRPATLCGRDEEEYAAVTTNSAYPAMVPKDHWVLMYNNGNIAAIVHPITFARDYAPVV